MVKKRWQLTQMKSFLGQCITQIFVISSFPSFTLIIGTSHHHGLVLARKILISDKWHSSSSPVTEHLHRVQMTDSVMIFLAFVSDKLIRSGQLVTKVHVSIQPKLTETHPRIIRHRKEGYLLCLQSLPSAQSAVLIRNW